MTQAFLQPTLSPREFEDRFQVLHKQLFALTEFVFNDVCTHAFAPPKGMYQADHSFVHDGTDWHLFYCTGDMKNTGEWLRRFRAGDMDGANEVCLEPGNGHATGKTLTALKFKEHVFFPPQGRQYLQGSSHQDVQNVLDAFEEEGIDLKILKLCPVEGVTPKYVNMLGGCFPGIVYCPTGEITLDNYPAWKASPFIAAPMGSRFVAREDLEKREFEKVRNSLRELTQLSHKV